MYFKSITVLACFAGLAMSPAMAASFKRIKSAEDFNSKVVGQKLTSEAGFFIIEASGKISGELNKHKAVGAWKWNQGFWCRTIKIGARDLGSNCQTIEVTQDQVKFTRDQGKGDETIFNLK